MSRYTDDDRALMVKLYEKGSGYTTISRQIGCSHNTVRAAVLDAGVTPRRSGAQRRLTGYGTWRRGRMNNGYIAWSAWDSRTGQTKYLLEHRLIMQWMLGRELAPGENVHHVDGDRANNAPSNLELWATSQPAGVRMWTAETLLTMQGWGAWPACSRRIGLR